MWCCHPMLPGFSCRMDARHGGRLPNPRRKLVFARDGSRVERKKKQPSFLKWTRNHTKRLPYEIAFTPEKKEMTSVANVVKRSRLEAVIDTHAAPEEKKEIKSIIE